MMAVRSYAAPPTPWSRDLEQPKIHPSAHVDPFSSLLGDIRVGENVMIAPGTSIHSDYGAPFHIGQRTTVQDGVLIHGLEQGRVRGDDGESYSVWIGDQTSITHMALIHGPAYVGSQCFIGFRSTIFNARIGDGCVVMMHCLIQDVEIPAGRYVPSGSVITSQQQADRLPDVRSVDRAFAEHVIGVNDSPRSGTHRAEDNDPVLPIQNEMATTYQSSTGLATEVVDHVRQLLAQGYRIGTEHANARQFQIASWKSCATIQATQEGAVLSALNACLSDHAGDYVRLIGIDSKAKRRVLEKIIQRPGDKPAAFSSNGSNASSNGSSAGGYSSVASSNHNAGSSGFAGQIRQVLNKGGRISVEYANKRQFQTSSWQSAGMLQSSNESAVISELNGILSAHTGEYVRIVGVDPKAKKRLLEMTIQRPNGPATMAGSGATTSHNGAAPASTTFVTATAGSSVADQVQQLLNQGASIGLEFADARRYKINSWNTVPAIQARSASDAMGQINNFLASHGNDYVRIVAVDRKLKKRLSETVIHRPGKASVTTATPSSSNGYSASAVKITQQSPSVNAPGRLSTIVIDQVRQLIRNGNKITLEYTDQRRYKINSWQTAGVVQATHEAGAIANIEGILSEFGGAYVRMVGTDVSAKRRVLETVIQNPTK